MQGLIMALSGNAIRIVSIAVLIWLLLVHRLDRCFIQIITSMQDWMTGGCGDVIQTAKILVIPLLTRQAKALMH